MQINDIIFSEILKRGYSVEKNVRVWNIADSKLWYLTSKQAQGFLNLEKSKEYQKEVIQKEINLIENNLKEILTEIGKRPLNIIDLGCGDGKKAVLFINYLKDKFELRYCPIDISGYMVKKAIDRIKKMNAGEVIEFKWNISDFENLENIANILRIDKYKKNLFLLLGNTLGNFEINDLMYKIRRSMHEDDFLLIGNGLDNKKRNEIIKSYDNKVVRDWLINIPTQIGIDKKNLKFEVCFNHSRVELYFVLKRDLRCYFQNKTIHFKKGDKILVAISYKYNEQDFKRYMKTYFDYVRVFIDEDKSYALVLCKK